MLAMTQDNELRFAFAYSHPFRIHYTDHGLRPSVTWTYAKRKRLYETLLLGVSPGSWAVWYPDDILHGVLLDGRQRYAATRRLFGLPTDPAIAKADGSESCKVQFNVFTRKFREVHGDVPPTAFDLPPDRRLQWIDTAYVLGLSDRDFATRYLVPFDGRVEGPQLDALRSVEALRSVGRVYQLVAHTHADLAQARWLTKVLNERPRRTCPPTD